MAQKTYIGIDTGRQGFISVLKGGKFTHYSIKDNDLLQLADILAQIRQESTNLVCVLESVHAIFGSSAKATFSFGEIYGKLQGLLVANKIPYHLIQPKEWQGQIWANNDKVSKYTGKNNKSGTPQIKTDTKETSINACKRLFPDLDLRKSERCKKIDDNKVDSVLMCEYARRMNF